MKIQIKNIYGNVVYETDAPDVKTALEKAVSEGANLQDANLQGANLQDANLQGAYLQGANLRGAYLQGANLQDAYLQGANLRGAYLQGANLRGANLQDAYLQGANLRGAYLQGANLQDAYLQGAYLQGAYLQGANLRGANLQGANLQGAYLQGAKNLPTLAFAQSRILPEGTLIGWKKCRTHDQRSYTLVKLEIPADAKRSHATGRKCRAEFVNVLEVVTGEYAISLHDGVTEYRPGQRVTCHQWCDDWTQECAGGIHFYITREEAENHI